MHSFGRGVLRCGEAFIHPGVCVCVCVCVCANMALSLAMHAHYTGLFWPRPQCPPGGYVSNLCDLWAFWSQHNPLRHLDTPGLLHREGGPCPRLTFKIVQLCKLHFIFPGQTSRPTPQRIHCILFPFDRKVSYNFFWKAPGLCTDLAAPAGQGEGAQAKQILLGHSVPLPVTQAMGPTTRQAGLVMSASGPGSISYPGDAADAPPDGGSRRHAVSSDDTALRGAAPVLLRRA